MRKERTRKDSRGIQGRVSEQLVRTMESGRGVPMMGKGEGKARKSTVAQKERGSEKLI